MKLALKLIEMYETGGETRTQAYDLCFGIVIAQLMAHITKPNSTGARIEKIITATLNDHEVSAQSDSHHSND